MNGRERGLAGRRVLVLSRRDVRHPQAGGPERYLHEIARRWAAGGARVTWAVARPPGAAAREVIDGVEVLRSGTPLGMYPRTALRLLRRRERFDAVVNATSGVLASATTLITGRPTPVVQVVHRVRPRVRSGRFSPFAVLGGLPARWSRGLRAVVALSPSARHELRRHLGFRGPVFVVPPGAPTTADTGERAADPTIVVVGSLVPEQRLDLLLDTVASVADRVPGLRVEVLGDGPELPRLSRIAHDAGVGSAVSFPGRLPDVERQARLRRAWLTVTTAADELCGCSVLEAAAHGVPCVALDTPGARDFVQDDRTGRIVDSPDDLAEELVRQLKVLADAEEARQAAERCREWADRFQWDRGARLLAGVVEHQIGAARRRPQRRYARFDLATVVRLPRGASVPDGALRVTDEIAEVDGVVSVLLNGCDEVDACAVLDRLEVTDATVRLARHIDLLVGPPTASWTARGGPEFRTSAHERG